MPTIQYSARSSPLSVHKLFTSCIRRYLVSRACDWVMSALSAVLLIYSFQSWPAFLPCRSARQHSGILVYPMSDIGCCRKFGSFFCTERTAQMNDFELILTVKMETRHLIEGSFGSEFPAICNHCGVMAAWSHKTLKCCEKCLHFCGKTTPYAKIFRILFRTFSQRHWSTLLCSNVVKFFRREMGKIVRYLTDQKEQKFACLLKCRYFADRTQNLPTRMLQISSKSVHFWREHRQIIP